MLSFVKETYLIIFSCRIVFVYISGSTLIQLDAIVDILQMLSDAFRGCTGILPGAGVAAWAITSGE